ncbi:MAG: hydantoinase B/oxoprolinase family protein [Gammaproteobacteria bacterium]
MSNLSERYRVAFDIGGTFTDFVLVDADGGAMQLHKCLTTPADPAIGVLQGLSDLLANAGLELSEIGHLVHGTTLVTNAIIERNGAKLALLTTRGLRDVLEMGHEQRYDIHDLFLQFPEPLVPRALRLEVDERMSRDGEVVVALDQDQVRAALATLIERGIDAIAVCFLHAYKNPAHEREVRDLITRTYPQLAVSISSDVQPELREYERTSTTAANAYVQPLVAHYVDRLVEAFEAQGFYGRFHLVQSSGGLISPSGAISFPVRLLESGPAGGGQASAFFGRLLGKPDLISFDMGGTTAKACLICDGAADVAPMMEAARVHRFKKGSGIPIKAPVIDMIEIGAGGGSIARVDDLGLLKVGPGSAGADPGPACYRLGGAAPTVTDANLLLGYLDPEYFLGGRMTLDTAGARSAVASVARPLSLSELEAAWGIYDIVCESMAGAARVHIVEKGRDPRRYAMVAMGGAGPAHAARVARKLGVGEVIVPPASGAASALGFLVAPISFDSSRSLPCLLDELDTGSVNALLAELENEGRSKLADAGVSARGVRVRRRADMRLFGQMHEIAVTLPDDALDLDSIDRLRTVFAAEYTRLYTRLYEGSQVQILNWRVECAGPTPDVSLQLGQGLPAPVRHERVRPAWFAEAGGFVDTGVYDRYTLIAGDRIEGPAIVEEPESTTVVPPGDVLEVDEHGNLRVSIDRSTHAGAIVTRDMSLAAAKARIESDPVGLEILWSRLINITEECWETVIRTAFSLIIGEAQDFACEILDGKGRQLAHSPRAMPVFNLTLPIAVNAMIERYPVETLHPGDVLITNDPWLCAGHLFDIAVATPVFREDRVVALVGVVGHVTDIGGTKDSLNAQEIYEEGLQIPPMMLCRAGEMNESLLALLRENVRNADQVVGDLHALVSAFLLGAERVNAFMEEYGMHDMEALASVVQERAEGAMRAAIREVPDGEYNGEIWNDGLGAPERYPIRVTVEDDDLEVDFEGAPPQVSRGAGNCTLGYTLAHTTYPLKCLLSPEVPGNAGCYRPLHVTVPRQSILNCDKPMAVNMRIRTGWYLAPNLFNAIAAAAPRRVQAFTGVPGSALFYGVDARGHTYNDHLFQGGGQGGSAHGDGKSGLLWPTSAGNTSVELFETRVPVLVIEKAFIADSGGPGRQRGGLGQRVLTRKLYENDGPTQVGLYPNGVSVPIGGLFDGRSGSLARAALLDNQGEELHNVGIGALLTLETPEVLAELCLGGGSGYGDPMTRPVEAVQRDVIDGYVTVEGALRDYGCVVGEDGKIDVEASERRRQERKHRLEPVE